MKQIEAIIPFNWAYLRSKILDYIQLVKLRLTLLVVFSASMAYLWTTQRNIDVQVIWLLSMGGFLITASSNIFNQIIEKESDKLMKRTARRPLPDGRMDVHEAIVAGLFSGVAGLFMLLRINFTSFILGFAAMILYIIIYTPLKKKTGWAVVPGAIAGSLPLIIGNVAVNDEITATSGSLFLIQFIWQFPHTWSIAWLLNDEYNRAGLKMLPTSGKTKTSALLILTSTFLVIPSGLLLYMYESAGIHVTWMLALAGLVMLFFAYRFYLLRTDRSALGFMLTCLAYLPLALIILVVEKFL